MKKLATVLVCSLSILTVILGCKKLELPDQNGRFIKVYGSDQDDEAYALVEASDGGFMIAGSMQNLRDTAGKTDFLFLRTDQYGNLRWRQTFGSVGYDMIEDIFRISEDEYLAVGTYNENDSDSKSIVMRLQETSDSLLRIWTKIEDTLELYRSKSALKASDGQYVVAGRITDGMLLTKYSPSGDIVWRTPTLGVSSVNGLTELSGGGFLVTGQSYNGIINSYAAAVWKFDAMGQKVEGYQSGVAYSTGMSIMELPDGNIVIGGDVVNGINDDAFISVLKPDPLIEIPNLYRTFGGTGNEHSHVIRLLLENDETVVSGWYTDSYGAGDYDYSISKIRISPANDSISADMWQNNRTYGGTGDDRLYAITRTADGGYALVGTSYSFSVSIRSSADIVLVRTDSEGRLDPED